jgi:hypothetical protein
MKTLHFISILAFMTILSLTTQAKEYKQEIVNNDESLRTVITEKIQSNISEPNNYLYEREVKSLNNNVKLTFFINKDGVMKVIDAECWCHDAAAYLEQLLDKTQLNVTSDMKGKKYSLNIRIIYKAL